jgi:pyrroloquinoline-quinone synthase
MAKCPACLEGFAASDWSALADHLVEEAARSDPEHVRFLNQNLTRKKSPAPDLVPGLHALFDRGGRPVSAWIVEKFVARFYGPAPHPFVVALQHPTREVLLGYVIEHQHFLRQWVRSCAEIVARTDEPRVIRYELDNLTTEFGGFGPDRPSHYELLLRMGESLGVPRATVLATPPLPATARGLRGWEAIARREPWVEAIAAMHSLELIANRELVRSGATIPYFDPSILRGTEIPAAAQAFLREGYEADVTHSTEALDLVNEIAVGPAAIEGVQATFLRSIDLFDDYLMARLERSYRLAA